MHKTHTTLNAGSEQQFPAEQFNEHMFNPLLFASFQIFVR